MLVKSAKVLTELALSLDIKIDLVTEEYDSASCNQPCEIVLLCVGELGKVDSMDFSSNLWVVIENIGGRTKEILELWVTKKSLVVIGNLGQGRPMKDWKVGTEMFKLVCVIMLLHHSSAGDVVNRLA